MGCRGFERLHSGRHTSYRPCNMSISFILLMNFYHRPPGPPGPVPEGEFTGDYLYWDATAEEWTVGSTEIYLGKNSDASGPNAIAIGELGKEHAFAHTVNAQEMASRTNPDPCLCLCSLFLFHLFFFFFLNATNQLRPRAVVASPLAQRRMLPAEMYPSPWATSQ